VLQKKARLLDCAGDKIDFNNVFHTKPHFHTFFFAILAIFQKKNTIKPLNDLISFLYPLLDIIDHDTKVTRLSAMTYDAKVISALDSHTALAPMWLSSTPRIMAPSSHL
jgi:hypothetical protein